MKLLAVTVTGLFGIFEHTVQLNQKDKITIIHGPNGYGKTAILRLISAVFEGQFHRLKSIPFERVTFKLDDGSTLLVSQHSQQTVVDSEKSSRKTVTFSCKSDQWEVPTLSEKNIDFPVDAVEDFIPSLNRIARQRWQDIYTGEALDIEDVVERFGDRFPSQRHLVKAPDWLVTLQDSLAVYFITATRLERPTERKSRVRFPPRVMHDYSEPAVAAHSRQIAEHIQNVLSRYAELSQSLDRTFPIRIVQSDSSRHLTLDEVKKQLNELEHKREELTNVGLLDREEQHAISAFPEIDPQKLDVLGVYVEDVRQKLDVFSGTQKRIELFKAMINKRFLFKRVDVDKRKGLVFRTDRGDMLVPTQLSTGEQHEIVMLYQLLFDVEEDSLILIDEPEISLHVVWQEMFLSDLSEIAGITKTNFLLATHSPQIINNRWDLTVELEAPKK